MKTTHKLLIFDWDGTLMDSEAHIVRSMQSAMQDMQLGMLDRNIIRNVIGLGMHEAVRTLFPTCTDQEFVEKFTANYRRYYFAPDAAQQLFDGVAETVEQFYEQGYLLAVATGKSRKGLDLSLAETGLNRFFHTSRCADETVSKPHPQMLDEILAELDLDPVKAVMIGDTEYDLQMARNAGTASIGVSYGVHEPERLLRHRPLACVDDIAEIANVLNGRLVSDGLPRVG